MSRVVDSYLLPKGKQDFTLRITAGAELCGVLAIGESVYLYARVNPNIEFSRERRFIVVSPGDEIPERFHRLVHIQTFERVMHRGLAVGDGTRVELLFEVMS